MALYNGSPFVSQSISLVAPMTYWGVGLYQLGLAMVRDAFVLAAMGLQGADTTGTWYGLSRKQACEESMAFVAGTGLEATLERFGMDNMSAERLRDEFYQWLERQKSA